MPTSAFCHVNIEKIFTGKVSALTTSLDAYFSCLAKRVNQAPIAVISPASQIVKLPNTGAVLDGSASKDDDKVIMYHWELQQGPIGYQPTLLDTPTLQLDNLIAGNYTFKLTLCYYTRRVFLVGNVEVLCAN